MPLILVGTPIGNLGDLSPRAAEALRRRRRGLLRGHPPHRPPASSWPASRARPASCGSTTTPRPTRVDEVVDRVRRGERVVVVSDAGMPGIADPGERLVRRRGRRRPAGRGGAGPVGRHHRARWRPGCRPGAGCSRASCPARAPPARSASPSWRPSVAPSSSTSRRTGRPARWPTWRRCWGPIVGSPWVGSSRSSTRRSGARRSPRRSPGPRPRSPWASWSSSSTARRAPAPAGDDDVEAAVVAALAAGPVGQGRRRQGGLGPGRPQAPGLRVGRRQPCHRTSVVCMVCAWPG